MKWLILLFPSLCFAKEYDLTYHLVNNRMDNTVIVKVDASSYNDAIRKGGPICVDAYDTKGLLGVVSNEAIANACTNPDHYLDDEYYR
jgi:hypothetical protein